MVLLPPHKVGRSLIREIKDRYHLSWRDMASGMGYASKSSVIEPYAHPEMITLAFSMRFDRMWAALERDRGHVYQVSAMDRLPWRFNLSVELRPCERCKVPTAFGDRRTRFCHECRGG